VKRKVAAALALALMVGLSLASCSPQPESSGTNTNWLKACVGSDECAAAGSCVCGLCTAGCASDADCRAGVCGTALASAFQCNRSTPERICLPNSPDAGTCSEFPIAGDGDLSPTPTPVCDVPGALLCENFDAPLPEEDSTWITGTMAASIGNCRVYQGAGAIHYRAPTSGYSQTRMRLAQPVPSGLLAARFYVYIPSQITIPDYLVLFELWDQETSESGKISIEAKPNDVFEVQVTPNGTTHPSAAGALLRDQWQCVTLTLELAASGSISLAVNGAPVIDQPSAVTLLPGPISVAVVEGLPSADTTGVDLSIDELVVATQPLACP
jgi:hypothetical protein